MSIGAYIEFLEGPLGNGKSLYANIRAMRFLRSGGVLALNYPLVKDWAWKHAYYVRKKWDSDADILKRAIGFYDRTYMFGSRDSLYELAEYIPNLVTGQKARQYEGWALAVFDEASLLFNARDWQKNHPYIEFFINCRKLKYQTFIISHDREDIDVQLQRKCEQITSVRNFNRRAFMGIPLSVVLKKPKFRTMTFIGGRGAGKGIKEYSSWFTMDEHVRSLYDSHEVFAAEGMADRPLKKIGEHPEVTFERVQQEKTYKKMMEVRAACVLPEDYFWTNKNQMRKVNQGATV